MPYKNKSKNTMTSSSDSDSCDSTSKMSRNSKRSPVITTRPHASPGFWLCTLMPLAYAMRYLRESPGPPDDCLAAAPTHKMLTIAAIGMCIESLCFFMYIFLNTNLVQKLVISFVPGLLTSGMFTLILQQTWTFGIFWGFAVTFCYQLVYIRVMRGLPKCFTYGEASILVQGVMLFVLNVVLNMPNLINGNAVKGVFQQLNIIMMFALLCLLIVCCMFTLLPRLRKPVWFYSVMIILLLAVTTTPVTQPLPVVALFNFIMQDQKRLLIILFYLLLVVLTIATVWWQLRNSEKASTRVRKIFHLLVILVYLPGMVYQCAFLYIASGVALALISVFELFRILNIPPLAEILNKAFGSFSDEKDSGMLALTPFCLLIGCSLPMWITPCPCAGAREILPNMAGLLTIGFGDTAASVIGSKMGKIKWKNSTRTLEGSTAYVLAILLPVYVLSSLQLIPLSTELWVYVIGATVVTAFVEARTTQIDNLILPIIFYSIVSVV